MADTTTPRRTREEQRAQTRADLLEAAAEVFARNGYHGTSVDMVAEAAGYTKGAVYSNFESKEELFLALLEARLEDSLGSMQDVMDTAEDRPAAFGRRRSEIAQWEPQWFMLEAEFELYAARNPEVRDRVAARQRQTRGVIEQALQQHIDDLGLKPAYPVDQLARLIVAAGDGMSLMALNNPDTTDTNELMRILLEVLARGATLDD
jgi:AcrR family transcriptional regulator